MSVVTYAPAMPIMNKMEAYLVSNLAFLKSGIVGKASDKALNDKSDNYSKALKDINTSTEVNALAAVGLYMNAQKDLNTVVKNISAATKYKEFNKIAGKPEVANLYIRFLTEYVSVEKDKIRRIEISVENIIKAIKSAVAGVEKSSEKKEDKKEEVKKEEVKKESISDIDEYLDEILESVELSDEEAVTEKFMTPANKDAKKIFNATNANVRAAHKDFRAAVKNDDYVTAKKIADNIIDYYDASIDYLMRQKNTTKDAENGVEIQKAKDSWTCLFITLGTFGRKTSRYKAMIKSLDELTREYHDSNNKDELDSSKFNTYKNRLIVILRGGRSEAMQLYDIIDVNKLQYDKRVAKISKKEMKQARKYDKAEAKISKSVNESSDDITLDDIVKSITESEVTLESIENDLMKQANNQNLDKDIEKLSKDIEKSENTNTNTNNSDVE